MKFAVAILWVIAALCVRIFLRPVLGDDSPFLFFFAALALSSWIGGLWPGILSTLLGAYSVSALGLLPIAQRGAVNYLHLMQYLVFIATGALVSILMEKLHVAIDRAIKSERNLEKRVQERTDELVEANRTLQRLSGELLSAQETERQRISKELHDELGQALTLIKMKVDLLDLKLNDSMKPLKELCEDASSHVDLAIENMRRLSRALSPITVETLGITAALRRLAEEFNSIGGIQFKAEITPIDDVFSPHSSILLYRIVQEGLNNIVKHSGADSATVSIKMYEHAVHFELKDNGRGFDLVKQNKRLEAGGLGLTILKERVRALGGSLTVESGEETGTTLQFDLPIRCETRTGSVSSSPVSEAKAKHDVAATNGLW